MPSFRPQQLKTNIPSYPGSTSAALVSQLIRTLTTTAAGNVAIRKPVTSSVRLIAGRRRVRPSAPNQTHSQQRISTGTFSSVGILITSPTSLRPQTSSNVSIGSSSLSPFLAIIHPNRLAGRSFRHALLHTRATERRSSAGTKSLFPNFSSEEDKMSSSVGANGMRRRGVATDATKATPTEAGTIKDDHTHPANPTTSPQSTKQTTHSHSHSHSHGGIFHSHSHAPGEGAEQLMEALKMGDKGSRITLIGLGSNVALTGMKGAAGLWLNSASLLAEAGHSLSDMLGDFVTLACWRISRRPPSDTYPWGYGKFETFGTLSVSMILVGGALGIGLHSYHLLLQVLLPFLEHLDASNPLHSIVPYLPKGVPSPLLEIFHSHSHTELLEAPTELSTHLVDHADAIASHGHSHGHEGTGLVSPHAAWFALISVIVKEYLFRATKKVAVELHSPVLDANALHHRSDALTSGVALISILLSSLPPSAFGSFPIPNGIFDPLGGLFVSFFILKQGIGMSKSAFLELLDKGVEDEVRTGVASLVRGMRDGEGAEGLEGLKGVRNVRGVKSGGLIFMDLTLSIDPHLTVLQSHEIERLVRNKVMEQRKQVRELKVHLHPWNELEEDEQDIVHEHELAEAKTSGPKQVTSDFGRDGC